MKISFLLPTLFASKVLFPERIFAPRQLAEDLVNGLSEKGHQVWVFSTPDFETKGTLVPGDIEPFEKKLPYDKLKHALEDEKRIRYDEVWKRSFEISLVTEAYIWAKKEHFDLMHSYHDFLFTPHYIEELTQVPTVYTLHDPLPPEGSFEYHQFGKFSRHRYVSISNAQRRSSLKLNFVATVYHGLKTAEFPFQNNPSDYLLFMGRPLPEKGLHFAIQAALATNMKLEIGTHFPGIEKEMPYFKKEIEPYLTNPLFGEPGIVAGKDKMLLYKQARALLFPIQWEEPFGMVMIEAMAAGTPVIAYNRGSVPEIVKDGVTGFIIDPPEADHRTQNPEHNDQSGSWIIKKRGIAGLVEAIQRLGEIDRAACHRHVEENFTVEKMVEGYENIYRKILAAR